MTEEIRLFESIQEAFDILKNLEIKKIQINQQFYGIVRVNDDIFVFEKDCPHASYDLTQGNISPLGRIVCPWHNYQFKLASGDEISSRCKGLQVTKTYLKEEAGLYCELPIL